MKCAYCGEPHSRYGLSLVQVVNGSGGVERTLCFSCGTRHEWSWFPLNMQSIFEMVDRIPWVPTSHEAKMFDLWYIDRAFARRTEKKELDVMAWSL